MFNGDVGLCLQRTHSLHSPLRSRSSAPSAKLLSIGTPAAPGDEPQRIKVPEKTLRLLNAAMCVFHAVLFAVTLYMSNIALRVPVYRTELQVTYYNETSGEFEEEMSGEFEEDSSGSTETGRVWKATPVYVERGHIYPTLLTAAFFGITSAFHFLSGVLPWTSEFYIDELEQCRTPLRWIEYSLSAPLMIVLVAYSLGMRSSDLLVAVAFLTCVTMPFGYWTEAAARPLTADRWEEPSRWRRLRPWLIGHVPQVAAWYLLLSRFYDSGLDMERIPWFVEFIIWSELVLFSSFGLAALFSQWHSPSWFYIGEIFFQLLSLVSKGMLGGILIANVLMLSSFDEIYNP